MSTTSQPLDLDQIDALMEKAYAEVRKQLSIVENKLSLLENEREQLAMRARKLEHGLGLSAEPREPSPEAAIPPAPTAPPAREEMPAEPTPAKAKRGSDEKAKTTKRAASGAKPKSNAKGKRRGRKPGKIWKDVRAVLKKSGEPMRAKDIIEAVKAKTKDPEESLDQKIYNSLGRWARENKLKKAGHGTYGL